MATWPAYAAILLDGFKLQRESALERTQMESGPPKQTRTKSRVMVARPATARFDSRADYLNFLAWFTSDIHRGADWFTWTDPVDGATKQARIRGGQLDEEAPFAHLAGAWRVRLTLETWDA